MIVKEVEYSFRIVFSMPIKCTIIRYYSVNLFELDL